MDRIIKQRWTIAELERIMKKELLASGLSDFERSNIKAICGIEIRQEAERLAAAGKLTSAAARIAEQYGYRPKAITSY